MPPLRVLLVNSGILGHASVAALLTEAVSGQGMVAETLDLSRGLTVGERAVRRAVCAGPASGAAFPGAALLLPRARRELHVGIQAARRIGHLERGGAGWDVIHFHPQATALASVGRMRRTPSVVSLDATQALASRGAHHPAAGFDYGVAEVLERRVYRHAAAVVPVSEWAAAGVRAAAPDAAERLSVLPYPVALTQFGGEWAREREARPDGRPLRVLFMGGDFERKGGNLLLRAWSGAGLEGRARLTLVTDWPLAQPLPAGVDLRRGVRAYTPEWRDLWREADLFVLPSRDEAFGMVLQESAAAGVPAIASRVNATSEIVLDGETGLLIPPGDVAALTAALHRLLGDDGQRAAMGTAARRHAEGAWSPERYAARLGDILRAAAEQSS